MNSIERQLQHTFLPLNLSRSGGRRNKNLFFMVRHKLDRNYREVDFCLRKGKNPLIIRSVQ